MEFVMTYGLDSGATATIQQYILNGRKETGMTQGARELMAFFLAGRSKSEADWVAGAKMLIEDEFKVGVAFAGYEWMTFKLPGGSYTPDWDYMLADGRWVFVEVKGSKLQPNYRDARSKLRACATLNPWFIFMEAITSGGIQLERIPPDVAYLERINSFIKDY
jgi:hypothetical protein